MVVNTVKAVILSISPSTTHPKHWFNSAEHHALEYTVYTFIWFSLLVYYVYFKGAKRKPLFYAPKHDIKPLEHLFGGLLITCLGVQSVYNIIMRPVVGIVIMLHPCHIISLLELYLIYGKNSQRLHTIFNLVVYYSFYTSLALIIPDTASLYLPLHKVVFWVQHWLVYLLPFYFVVVNRFAIDHRDLYYFFVSVSIANLYFWNIEFPVSLATSTNINYTLWPSAGSPPFAAGKFYRTIQGLGFAVLVGIHGYFMPKLFQLGRKIASPPSPPSTSTAKSKLKAK